MIFTSHWDRISPHVGDRVALHGTNDRHVGRIVRLQLWADGSATVTFDDGVLVMVDALRAHPGRGWSTSPAVGEPPREDP